MVIRNKEYYKQFNEMMIKARKEANYCARRLKDVNAFIL